jgi:nucleoid-associated protein YgaU
VTNWDYVWEPVKTRAAAKKPIIPPKPAPPAPPPPVIVPPPAGVKTVVVGPGDTLGKIAKKVYGNAALWTKIYQANQGVIGPNPNLIKPGQKLVIP